MVIGAFIVTGQSRLTQIFTSLGCITGRDFILREDGFKWAFRDASAAIDAGIRVDIKPRPFRYRFTGDNAFHRANIYTSRIAQAKTGNNMGHGRSSYIKIWKVFKLAVSFRKMI
jgi:hypothetical protein